MFTPSRSVGSTPPDREGGATVAGVCSDLLWGRRFHPLVTALVVCTAPLAAGGCIAGDHLTLNEEHGRFGIRLTDSD